jgi:hypothetical protein
MDMAFQLAEAISGVFASRFSIANLEESAAATSARRGRAAEGFAELTTWS